MPAPWRATSSAAPAGHRPHPGQRLARPPVREAVGATGTGRRKLLIAGTGLDVCAQLPALASAADGYQPYVVIDACGRFEPQPSVVTVSRLTQAGVALVTTRVVVLEAMADNAHPKATQINATLPTGLVTMDDSRGE